MRKDWVIWRLRGSERWTLMEMRMRKQTARPRLTPKATPTGMAKQMQMVKPKEIDTQMQKDLPMATQMGSD